MSELSVISMQLFIRIFLKFQGFFVIRLQNTPNEILEIKDPDPLMNCDLMDGRDAFLTLARDKHYEFSSLRRAKYSSMGLLYELHNQARDGFIYSCNDCKANVETRYHCSICDVSTSCANYFIHINPSWSCLRWSISLIYLISFFSFFTGRNSVHVVTNYL